MFDPAPELAGGATRLAGTEDAEGQGFADCGGALYVSINTKLYRRNDGALPAGVASLGARVPGAAGRRAQQRAARPDVHAHHGAPALLVSTEGNGDVYRLDHLPAGDLTTAAVPLAGRLTPILEFAPIPAIRHDARRQGTGCRRRGSGSIDYVIAAYNNFDDGRSSAPQRQCSGFEWGYAGACPPTRTVGPPFGKFTSMQQRASRSAPITGLVADLRPALPRAVRHSHPRARQATRSAPARRSSRSGRSRRRRSVTAALYYGGYDCNFYPADGTAWVATLRRSSAHRSVTYEEARSDALRDAALARPHAVLAIGAVRRVQLELRLEVGAVDERRCAVDDFDRARADRAGEGRPDRHVPRRRPGIHKIKHVIVIQQENRSFDSYFGTFPGADGIPMKNGKPTVCVTDPKTKHVRARRTSTTPT